MKTAKQRLEEFTASSFRDPKKAAEMFSDARAPLHEGKCH